MTQFVTFENQATENPQEVVSYSRHVINDSTGMGTDALLEAVSKHIPYVEGKDTTTVKKIVFVTRYECPCCPTDITALVEVHCEGVYTPESENIAGLYEVKFYQNSSDSPCTLTVKKLIGQPVFSGKVAPLPKKDYVAFKNGTYRG
ncbi:hypothetical protein HZC53_00890 [Candidatus Uhrbacteria bacterium]|nr:hypothetical protein [Candidatus Uhrbacteria bacterium]